MPDKNYNLSGIVHSMKPIGITGSLLLIFEDNLKNQFTIQDNAVLMLDGHTKLEKHELMQWFETERSFGNVIRCQAHMRHYRQLIDEINFYILDPKGPK